MKLTSLSKYHVSAPHLFEFVLIFLKYIYDTCQVYNVPRVNLIW